MQTTYIEWTEVGKHNRYDDAWLVINGGVYNPTKFVEFHPGGPALIQNRAGQDATRDFTQQRHSPGAYTKLETLRVGTVAPHSKPAEWQMTKKSQIMVTYFSFAVVIFIISYSIYVLMNGPYDNSRLDGL